MKAVFLPYKEASISLPAFEAWCRANLPAYAGNCTYGHALAVILSEENEEQEAAALTKWDEIGPDHEWASSYRSEAQIAERAAARADALRQRKLGMLEKTWAQMNAVERKLYLGLDSEVSNEDLGLE